MKHIVTESYVLYGQYRTLCLQSYETTFPCKWICPWDDVHSFPLENNNSQLISLLEFFQHRHERNRQVHGEQSWNRARRRPYIIQHISIQSERHTKNILSWIVTAFCRLHCEIRLNPEEYENDIDIDDNEDNI